MIICRTDDFKTVKSGFIDLGISDHNFVYVSRQSSIPKGNPKVVKTRQFKNFKAEKFQNDLKHAFTNLEEYSREALKP